MLACCKGLVEAESSVGTEVIGQSVHRVARSAGFEPAAPEVINLGALTGLSYERIIWRGVVQ